MTLVAVEPGPRLQAPPPTPGRRGIHGSGRLLLGPPALTPWPPCLSGEAAAVDTEAIYQHLFTRIPSELFHSPMLAFEFVQFCRDNLPLFGRSLGILKLSFPNLFKARAIVLGPGRELGAGAGVR